VDRPGYCAIAGALIVRMSLRLRAFRRSVRGAETERFGPATLVYTDRPAAPYTILRRVFIRREHRAAGEILSHELAHVRQRHTLDILFVEALRAVCWLNPALPFYRRAMVLNHEYLADEAVVRQGTNRRQYLHTLITASTFGMNDPAFSLCFQNRSTLKKRVKMMMKKSSTVGRALRLAVVVPMAGLALYLFAGQAVAQEEEGIATENSVQSDDPASDYNRILNSHIDDSKALHLNNFSESEMARLEQLYDLMTPEQRAELSLIPARLGPLDKNTPTAKEFESWKDPAQYGVWIDGKRVENTELNRYKASDFSWYMASKLERNAANYGKQVYQLDLYTTPYFKEWNARRAADPKVYLRPNQSFKQK
jgi:hypothetical protein